MAVADARRAARRWVALLAALTMLVVLSGCSGGPDYADLPLPGKNVRGETYRMTATFTEALNLAQGAPVKVNGVPVGRVQTVTAEDFKAKVTMDVKRSARLRVGSQARLRYDTPLGELFLQITPSRTGELLRDGDSLRERDVTTAPTVEDTLASASLLINGGGLDQLRTITDELNTALGGREPLVRRTLARLNTFLSAAQSSTGDIDRVLNALATTSRVLGRRQETIDRALNETVPISRVIRSNTDDIVRLLRAVDSLSVTAERVVGATKQQLLSILRQTGPIIDQVLATRPQFVPGLKNLISAAAFLDRTVEGDFIPLDAELTLDQTELSPPGGQPAPLPSTPPLPLPTLPGIPNLPAPPGGGGVPDLPLPLPRSSALHSMTLGAMVGD